MTPIKALNDTSRSFSTINVETGISATGCLLQDGDRISVWADTSGTYYFDTYLVYANPVVVSGTLVYSFTVKKDHYVIAKVSPSVQAVDTRKMYGQPNIDGGLVADANADIRNVNFYNWVFKGGIFLGNMPFGSGDNSGLSRIQVSMGTTVYTPVASSLSMMYLGVPPGQTPGLKIGLWPWAQSLANPTQYDSGANLNWATQWVPASTTLSTTNVAWPFVDGTQTSSVTLSSSTPTKEYLNWPIKFSAPTASTTYYAFPGIPTGLPYGFMVAVADEQTFFDTSETGWAYFADSAFQALPVNAIAPLNDSAARVWNVNITSSTLTNYP
jgi:hypothetical protein